MAREPASLAALLLTQRLVDTGVEPLKASEYWRLVESTGGELSGLLGADAATLVALPGFDRALADRVGSLLGASVSFALALDEAEQTGVRAITSIDDDYPRLYRERLGPAAPPMLYAVGDTTLLNQPAFGIVGSRKVDEAGAKAAQDAARKAVEVGYVVVSGGAKGVDRLAMDAALRAEGCCIGVLADSLTRTARDPDVRRAVVDERLCLITPYKPTAGFSAGNAMGRNKLIYGLAEATLVVASDLEKGGTWSGAVEALKLGLGQVHAVPGGGEGNTRLIELGATAYGDSVNTTGKTSAGQQLTLEL